MSCLRVWIVFLVAVAFAPNAFAAEVDEAVVDRILANFPDLDPAYISVSPVDGLYQVLIGTRIAYVSTDGRYLLQGDVFDVVTEENLTETQRMSVRMQALENVGESSMILFEPENVKHTVTVFTDIDCGYCRKLHRQMDDYLARGIRVRYMFFPRSGPDTDSWFKADHVWCAEDRNAALTLAKNGAEVDAADCGTTPVAQHYELGRSMGINGTPAIIADTGELIPGYVSPDELSEHFED
jgi:thiol:disulfide interchange protein DsbC